MHVERAVFDDGGADGDGQVHIVVKAPAADGAAVDIAFFRLQLFNDFQRAYFGRARERAGREGGGENIHIVHAVFQAAFDVGDDVHHVRVFFDDHFVGYAHAAGAADAADVVAAEIDQHHVFGNFFFVGQKFALVLRVFFGGGAAQAGAGNRPHDDLVALAAHQDFGRRADDMEIAEIVVEHIGRGVERAQGAVERQRFVGKGQAHALAGDDLHAVAVENIVAHAAHVFFVTCFAGAVLRFGFQAAQRQRDGDALAQLFAQVFQPFAGALVGVVLRRVGVNDEIDFAGQIVHHRQLLRQHQQDVGRAQRVGLFRLL